jgi:hypothetical protein
MGRAARSRRWLVIEHEVVLFDALESLENSAAFLQCVVPTKSADHASKASERQPCPGPTPALPLTDAPTDLAWINPRTCPTKVEAERI